MLNVDAGNVQFCISNQCFCAFVKLTVDKESAPYMYPLFKPPADMQLKLRDKSSRTYKAHGYQNSIMTKYSKFRGILKDKNRRTNTYYRHELGGVGSAALERSVAKITGALNLSLLQKCNTLINTWTS